VAECIWSVIPLAKPECGTRWIFQASLTNPDGAPVEERVDTAVRVFLN
jgi:hypothetical protein